MRDFIFVGKKDEFFIINFLRKKNFNLINIDEALRLSNLIIIVGTKASKEEFLEIIKLLKPFETQCIVFIPLSFKGVEFDERFKIVNYPIHISKFENLIEKFFNYKDLIFKELVVKNNGVVWSSLNNQKVFFTEKEILILKYLMKEKKVEKELLKKNVLNIQGNLDTKSLDSHLSRIRKKINEISKNVSIISVDKKYVKII